MQTTTTISLPKNLAKEVEKQIDEGKFTSKSEFFRSAVRTYLLLQQGQLSWEILAAPFRRYAKQKKLTKNDVIKIVEGDSNEWPRYAIYTSRLAEIAS